MCRLVQRKAEQICISVHMLKHKCKLGTARVVSLSASLKPGGCLVFFWGVEAAPLQPEV
jgi:hypothetical protein